MINTLFTIQPFTLAFVIGTYLAALWLYRRTKLNLLHPVFTSILVVIGALLLLDVEYAAFEQGSFLIDFMLGPSVVALGFGLYEQVHLIRKNLLSILTAITIGSIVGIVSVVFIARWMGADETVVASLEPKSVTTPIAIGISARFGGLPPLTAVVVVVTGVFGAVVGPFVMDKTGITSKIARGLAMGSSSHGAGTARAIEMGAVQGAISGLSIGLMGVATAIMVPLLRLIIK
ncbi:LrgB family protein [Natronoflexus pectinivorans]|uniref:Putative murein hydrolase (TIGR00659 family) n=1 Tax=Natronoflexus pectinivorans TaxID=682526 RepID=A0A4R2GGM8_9BACT|nr:LrgB family protein [Natronoflexus pectinivorans]TCO07469.1 putative murein hydrolase (TIGR00659 family) [Natronoflexus pectinivorans]